MEGHSELGEPEGDAEVVKGKDEEENIGLLNKLLPAARVGDVCQVAAEAEEAEDGEGEIGAEEEGFFLLSGDEATGEECDPGGGEQQQD